MGPQMLVEVSSPLAWATSSNRASISSRNLSRPATLSSSGCPRSPSWLQASTHPPPCGSKSTPAARVHVWISGHKARQWRLTLQHVQNRLFIVVQPSGVHAGIHAAAALCGREELDLPGFQPVIEYVCVDLGGSQQVEQRGCKLRPLGCLRPVGEVAQQAAISQRTTVHFGHGVGCIVDRGEVQSHLRVARPIALDVVQTKPDLARRGI